MGLSCSRVKQNTWGSWKIKTIESISFAWLRMLKLMMITAYRRVFIIKPPYNQLAFWLVNYKTLGVLRYSSLRSLKKYKGSRTKKIRLWLVLFSFFLLVSFPGGLISLFYRFSFSALCTYQAYVLDHSSWEKMVRFFIHLTIANKELANVSPLVQFKILSTNL